MSLPVAVGETPTATGSDPLTQASRPVCALHSLRYMTSTIPAAASGGASSAALAADVRKWPILSCQFGRPRPRFQAPPPHRLAVNEAPFRAALLAVDLYIVLPESGHVVMLFDDLPSPQGHRYWDAYAS
jgi:hypothetical protein